MNKRIGFIGVGNMGGAIIGGILSTAIVSPHEIIASDVNVEGLSNIKKKYGIETSVNNLDVAESADILFLSVKPNVFPQVIGQIKSGVKKDAVIVSIAAGQSIKTIEDLFEKEIKLVRAMPNMPALVGEGMSALSHNSFVSKSEIEEIAKIFNCFGKSEIVEEGLMDAVVGVSGSSPAYVYMFIEAMADAAVAEGMPRNQAYKFAAQAVLGSAKMVLETGNQPGELKDMVCSPGGTTIEAVIMLEDQGMRKAVMAAVKAASEKSRQMSK